MYDNINTYYSDARVFINAITANSVIDVLEADVKADKMTAEKYAYLSKAYIFAGDDILALEYAQRAIDMDSTYSYGYIRVAFAYAHIGQKEECLRYLKFAEEYCLSNDNLVITFMVMLYEFCGETRRAEQFLQVLKKNYKSSPEYFYYIGFIYHQKDPQKALDWFKRAESLGYEDKFNLWLNIAENYEALEDYENAEIYVDKCLLEGDTAYLLNLKAECLKEREEYEDAIKFLSKKYHKFDKTHKEKVQTLALLIYDASNIYDKNKCEHYINFAVKNFEPESSLYYVLAAYYESIEDYTKALSYYKKLIIHGEDDAASYSSVSFCYSKIGNNELALEFADVAIEKEPNNAYSYYRKGRVYSNMKEYSMAIEWFLKAIELDKSDVDSHQWASYCYSMVKDYDKSLEFANRAILLDKDDAYSYFRKAWAYQEIGRYQEAIRYYEDCIKCNDKYVDAYLNISFIYSKLKDSQQSLLYANKALLINKDYAYAHYRKAWALQECGRLDEAYDGYSKAIELDPTDIYNYLGIACISLNTNDSSSALLYANKAIFIDRSCGGAYYYKSLALSNLGKIKESEAAYTKAIELGYVPVV